MCEFPGVQIATTAEGCGDCKPYPRPFVHVLCGTYRFGSSFSFVLLMLVVRVVPAGVRGSRIAVNAVGPQWLSIWRFVIFV